MASMSRAGLRDLVLPGETARLSVVLHAFLDACPPDKQLRDRNGALRRDVRVFVDDRLVRDPWGSAAPVADGAEVWLVPAASGG